MAGSQTRSVLEKMQHPVPRVPSFGEMCSSDGTISSKDRITLEKLARSPRLVSTSENKTLRVLPSDSPSKVSSSMVGNAFFPYRHGIALFLVSYVFCLLLIHDQIQVARRMDALVVHVRRRHILDWNSTAMKEKRPPTYVDLNLLARTSSEKENHVQMDELFEEIEDMHEPYRKPFSELKSFHSDLEEIQEKLSKALGMGLRSCRWNGSSFVDQIRCANPKGPIVYYNRFDQPRHVCGRILDPGNHLEFNEPCRKPTTLFAGPIESQKKADQIVLRAQDPLRLHRPTKVTCDVPCATAGSPQYPVTTWSIDGTNWKVISSKEGSQKYSSLHIRPHAYQDDVIWSTTSFKSEIPLPFYSINTSIQGPPADYGKARRAALFWEDDCSTYSNREGKVASLQASGGFPIESVGNCLRNTDVPSACNGRSKSCVLQKYMFYIAFEDQIESDYITERVWEAFAAGSIPVYYGAENIQEHVPANSVIVASDFRDMDSLATYLNKVSSDRTLYEFFHEWRNKPLPDYFLIKYKFTTTDATCRTCRWAHSRKYGHSWNTVSQQFKPVVRTACIDGGGMITTPVQESWHVKGGDHQTALLRDGVFPTSCRLANVVASIADTQRTVNEKDGILDLSLGESVNSSLLWEFRLPFEKEVSLKNVDEGLAWAQDSNRRVSFLTWPRSSVRLVAPATVRVPVVPNLKLRIVVEDLDDFHDGGRDMENYFGRKMREDLWNPIEMFEFDRALPL